MLNKIKDIIAGNSCPDCNNKYLYRLKDKRFKCNRCEYRFNPVKFSHSLTLLHYFSLEIPANKAAKDLGFSYKEVRVQYMGFRVKIYEFLEKEFKELSGEIECDESYFCGKRKGFRGRGWTNKVKVLGMLERRGKILTTVVDDVKAIALMDEIKRYAGKGSVFYTDQFRSYNSLKFYGKHYIIHQDNDFVKGERQVNGLEGFWSFAKERLLKYHGVSTKHFLLYLKELEFRHNYRKQNLFNLLTKIHFSPIFT